MGFKGDNKKTEEGVVLLDQMGKRDVSCFEGNILRITNYE